jgi:hypothetical protein
LGEFPNVRTPDRNFLLVRLSITNSGAQQQVVPQLSVENSAGTSYPESTDGSLVPGWLGMLRTVQPAATEEGRILFDVPTNSYRLRVPEGGGLEDERFAFIKLPLSLGADVDLNRTQQQ